MSKIIIEQGELRFMTDRRWNQLKSCAGLKPLLFILCCKFFKWKTITGVKHTHIIIKIISLVIKSVMACWTVWFQVFLCSLYYHWFLMVYIISFSHCCSFWCFWEVKGKFLAACTIIGFVRGLMLLYSLGNCNLPNYRYLQQHWPLWFIWSP